MDIFEFGYKTVGPLLSDQECASLLRGLTGTTQTRAGARHLMSNPAIRGLAQDKRMLEIARAALGGAAVPFRATLFAKSQSLNWLIPWHQDTALPLSDRVYGPQWQSWSQKGGIYYAHAPAWALARVVALRVHLDESTNENGPLRVTPGSHRFAVLTDKCSITFGETRQQRARFLTAESWRCGPC
jgi:ectoine hydroxylase-related dioxygenase (phytanoyl-CoA dioxygenase family)